MEVVRGPRVMHTTAPNGDEKEGQNAGWVTA